MHSKADVSFLSLISEKYKPFSKHKIAMDIKKPD